MTIQPSWDDPSLQVASDTRWRACYRALQSWYRETVLGVPPGKDQRGTVRANMLLSEDGEKGLNFLDDNIAEYAKFRTDEIKSEGGTVDHDRLKRNMLSSMPLCFNLFGYLREHRDEAAQGLAAVLDLDIDKVLNVSVEWAPDRKVHLQDRTAFDAFVVYARSDGRRAFLGVETKYTESFSPTRYASERYTCITRDPTSGFKAGAEKRLCEPATNQLWRNALLVHSLRSTDEFADGHVVVISCKRDPGAKKAIVGLERELDDPAALLRTVTYEEVVSQFATMPGCDGWARKFQRRYLDLSPVGRSRSHHASNP